MQILDYIESLKLSNFYLAADAIFQTIWNFDDNKPLNHGIKDIDIVYYDANNISKEYEKSIEEKLLSI